MPRTIAARSNKEKRLQKATGPTTRIRTANPDNTVRTNSATRNPLMKRMEISIEKTRNERKGPARKHKAITTGARMFLSGIRVGVGIFGGGF
jgi:hypothetical protein